jgi:hypothetical protein
VQELLIGLKRWQLGKHPTVSCGSKRCIDCHIGSRRRQAVISNRSGGLIHESIHSNVVLRTRPPSFLNRLSISPRKTYAFKVRTSRDQGASGNPCFQLPYILASSTDR